MNTVCYPPDQHQNSCPITEMKFVGNAEIEKYKAEPGIWTVKEFSFEDQELYLVYSKTSDNLPIVTTRVESGVPCLDPDDFS